MAADARVKAYAVNDLLRVQTLTLRIGIQLVKVGNAQRQIGVGEQLDSLGLGKAHEEGINVLLDGPLLQQRRKLVGGCNKVRILGVGADDDAGRVKVVIQGLGLPQKFRAEQDVPAAELFPHRHRVADRNRGFDDHDGVWVDLHDKANDCLHRRGVKVLGLAVVVGGCSDDNKVCIGVGCLCVQRGGQIQLLLGQILFNVIILNRRFARVDQCDLFRQDIHRRHMMVLGKQRGDRKPHIAGPGHRDLIFFHSSYTPQLRIFRKAAAKMALCRPTVCGFIIPCHQPQFKIAPGVTVLCAESVSIGRPGILQAVGCVAAV